MTDGRGQVESRAEKRGEVHAGLW